MKSLIFTLIIFCTSIAYSNTDLIEVEFTGKVSSKINFSLGDPINGLSGSAYYQLIFIESETNFEIKTKYKVKATGLEKPETWFLENMELVEGDTVRVKGVMNKRLFIVEKIDSIEVLLNQ